METLFSDINSKLDLVFFVYGLSFFCMGLLLLVQPKRGTSFALADHLWLLGWFGLVHGLNEFLDMWSLIRQQGQLYQAAKTAVLTASFLLLLEFGRRSAGALRSEQAAWCRKIPDIFGHYLTPVLGAAVLVLAVMAPDIAGALPGYSRLLLGFPGALFSALAFLGYTRCRGSTLLRVNARKFFILSGIAFLAYAALGGLFFTTEGDFPRAVLSNQDFQAVFGLPVQLFRAACAVAAFSGILGVLRIYRESDLQAAQRELLDIIEFFPDATFVIDRERKVIAWNRALEHMTGVPKKEMLGKGDFAYAVPFWGERRPILIDLIGGAHPDAEKLYQYVKKRSDGAIYAEVFVPSLYGGVGAHVWVTASPLKDKDGNVYGAIESVRDITDRKRAEEALHQSEAQYRALIETTNTGFLIIDEEGRVLDANQEYVRMAGRKSLAEIHGRPVLEWTAPYELKKNARAIQSCRETGFIRNFEVDYVHKNGVIQPLELNATVVEIDGQKRILTLCRDITDRKRAETQLRESEGKFRTLTEKSLVGVYLVQDGLFRYASPKLAEIFGYTVEELTDKKSPRDLVQPADWPLVSENLRKRLDGEIKDINYSFRGVRKDGTPIIVEVFGSRSEYKGKPAVLGTLLDVTERIRTQEALRESEELYRTLFANAPVGIVVHAEGVIRFINARMAEIVLISPPEEAVGRNVLDYVHPDYHAFVKERVMRHLADTPSLGPAEEKLVRTDGAVVDVEINSVPIVYKGERCAMAIVQDITGRKRAEAALKAAHDQLVEANTALEGRVAERTVQLEELNKELEAFSYSAAHDMKAPLRRVNIFAELLEKEAGPALNAEQVSNLGMIRKGVRQMTALVDGLLALSTTGRRPLELIAVNLSEVAAEALAELKPETQGREIQWKLDPLPEYSCDRAMMKQVFANLLGNAVKYTQGRSPALIEVFCERQGGEKVIAVRDNGVGFDMAHYDKLFGVFQRLHKATEFSGTGIGLSIVRRIIQRHGGRIWAASEPGKGTTFYFALPG